jgi:hypothetical protein
MSIAKPQDRVHSFRREIKTDIKEIAAGKAERASIQALGYVDPLSIVTRAYIIQ